VSSLRQYLAEIGRRGGIRSRRVLDPETARRMVRIREARRAANHARVVASRLGGTPADTGTRTQAIQDALWRRTSPGDKLAQVARLARMVDRLSLEGFRQRHPSDDDGMIRYRHASMRLGPDLAARVYRDRRDAG
jgi:hypothetical protein